MDCLEGMRGMPDNCVDSIVTDPPYGLKFLGKKWDCDVPSVEIWKECLRVLKPGGYLLSFAGTRTQHRMACNIEDAGFEIRDMIAWVYGSGFPKSLDIGKNVDKLQGNEREVIGDKKLWGHNAGSGAGSFSKNQYEGQIGIIKIEPLTKGISEYEGWGTALKPALEPITVARKPLSEKTVAENVLKWGTGGINVDGCRVELTKYDHEEYIPKRCGWKDGINYKQTGTTKKEDNLYKLGFTENKKPNQVIKPQGRFPANLIHDGSDEVVGILDRQSGILTSGGGNKRAKKPSLFLSEIRHRDGGIYEQNSGSAARFFYCAKASKSERGKDNNHPTVKPLKLMRYLVRLVTPPKGIALDPYAGSGTTLLACISEGMNFVGFENVKDSFKIANKRIESHQIQLQLWI